MHVCVCVCVCVCIYLYIYNTHTHTDDTVKLFRKAEVNLAAVKGIIPNLHYQV